MSDLISRQAVLDILKHSGVWHDRIEAIKALPSAEPPYQYSEAYVKQIRAERDYLQELVNDMAKPKTGHWIKITAEEDEEMAFMGWVKCSNCKSKVAICTDFCPHCGADMRGEQDD